MENSILITKVIKLFEKVNPACKRMYDNKTQRKAALDLVTQYGLDEIEDVLQILPVSNTIPYIPTATTPLQLWEKYQAIKNAWMKRKNELQANKRRIII